MMTACAAACPVLHACACRSAGDYYFWGVSNMYCVVGSVLTVCCSCCMTELRGSEACHFIRCA
jgi:hypothetical protein